jgi:hypothetical protein
MGDLSRQSKVEIATALAGFGGGRTLDRRAAAWIGRDVAYWPETEVPNCQTNV